MQDKDKNILLLCRPHIADLFLLMLDLSNDLRIVKPKDTIYKDTKCDDCCCADDCYIMTMMPPFKAFDRSPARLE